MLEPDVFTTGGGPRRLDLPCGYYYLDAIEGAVTIAAHGRTALFIGGDVDAGSAMAFVVDPGATLDVFIGGTLRATSSLRVGSPAHPRNVRFYVGGVDTSVDPPRSVDLTSDVDLAGLFYAPYGVVSSTSSLEMYGAIFAGDFHNTAATRIHYDAAALGVQLVPGLRQPGLHRGGVRGLHGQLAVLRAAPLRRGHLRASPVLTPLIAGAARGAPRGRRPRGRRGRRARPSCRPRGPAGAPWPRRSREPRRPPCG
jgi:hypothetical protein